MDIETVDGMRCGVTGPAEDHVLARRARAEARRRLAGRVDARNACRCSPAILLRADDGALTLAATDMELSLRASLEAQVEGEGAVVVPGKPARRPRAAAARERGDARVPAEEGTVADRLRARRATRLTRLQRRGLPAAAGSRRAAPRVDRDALLETIDRVARSASRDESRPVLTGILVRFEAGKLVMAATDSYRLSVKETPLGERGAGARGDHPGARARRSSSRLARRRHGRARRPREPGRLRDRRRRG